MRELCFVSIVPNLVIMILCQIRMSKRQELVDIGWDLSLRALLKRAAVMSSIWLVRKRFGKGMRVIINSQI